MIRQQRSFTNAWRRRLAACFLAVVCGLAGPAGAAAPAADFIPLDEIAPGMTGYGLTVFAGTRVDTFAVTVIGIQENVRAAGSLLLIEVSGHGLEKSSIAQGMSGSPIFLEGRFAGALAFGWGGALRPIAGVTPAAEILALPTRLPAAGPAVRQTSRPQFESLVPPGCRTDLLAASLLAGDGGWAAPLLPVAVGVPADVAPGAWPDPHDLLVELMTAAGNGSPPDPRSWIYQPLGIGAGAAGAQGATAAAAPTALVPGSACAVPLVIGDAHLGVIGTVTWVDGRQVYMMGHPFLQRGPVDLPLATARILTLFPSRQMSFKMGTIGDIVGAVHHDQRAGLSGRLGPAPAMVDVGITLALPADEGAAVREFAFQVVDDPTLTPTLVFWTLYNALLVEGDDASLQTLNYRMETRWEGAAAVAEQPLVFEGVVAGPGGATGLASQLMAPLQILLNNPYAEVHLKKVTASFTVTRPMATATITGISGPRHLPGPGAEVVFQVELEPRRGVKEFISVPVILPDNLEPGPFRVVAASAAELFALEAQRAPDRFRTASLGAAVDILGTARSAATLAVALLAPGEAMILKGREMKNLPASVAQTLKAGNMQAGRALADYVLRTDTATPWVLQGHAVRALTLEAAPEPAKEERRP